MARQLAFTVGHREVVTKRRFPSALRVPVASLPLHLSASNPVCRPLSPSPSSTTFALTYFLRWPLSSLSVHLPLVVFPFLSSFTSTHVIHRCTSAVLGHISIDSALSLRNKLLLNSISPQQQLQYQQVARRNHNTYVSSPPPTFPMFPVVRPPRPCPHSRPRNDDRDHILYYILDGNWSRLL
ncbi:hypothetical protein C8R44DRAFT_992744 [Mycena epipterygia]|nr:hypothetical protein C8R44DRAFT_992744 [Mycena epipterygia]